MNKFSNLPHGITAEDLRILLDYWPSLEKDLINTQDELVHDLDKFLNTESAPIAWCHLYELPIKEHLIAVFTDPHLPQEAIAGWLRQIAATPGQISALPKIAPQVDEYFASAPDLSEEQAKVLRQHLPKIFAWSRSAYYSLRCVMYHGCFLNELIDRVRAGDDKALFHAVRIDVTTLGCKTLSERISRAAFAKEQAFFSKLKAALNGKTTKREQANFQKMRLVLEVLHEVGANRLSDTQLQELFVKELKLYSGNAKDGGCDKALRKFADTYMRKNNTT